MFWLKDSSNPFLKAGSIRSETVTAKLNLSFWAQHKSPAS